MAEPEDAANEPGADGMGPAPHGPSFLPWSPAPAPEPHREPAPPHPIPGRPTPSRLPAIISIVAIGLVAAVVVAASTERALIPVRMTNTAVMETAMTCAVLCA